MSIMHPDDLRMKMIDPALWTWMLRVPGCINTTLQFQFQEKYEKPKFPHFDSNFIFKDDKIAGLRDKLGRLELLTRIHVFRGCVDSYAKIVATSAIVPFSLVSFLLFPSGQKCFWKISKQRAKKEAIRSNKLEGPAGATKFQCHMRQGSLEIYIYI